MTLWRQFITERNAAIIEHCNNPVVFVLEASNLPLASQCVTLTDCQRVQKRMKTHTALGLREPAFQNEPNKIHISQRKTQLLVFSRMLAFWRLGERASGAMVGVGLRSATLSVHSLCSSSREGGCIKPVQIHFFKAVPLRLSNLNPAPC